MQNHLTDIEIKDFKCFKDFKAEGFKRVNLIGGKNNVGKTTFVEACFVNVASENIDTFWSSLYSLKFRRDNLEYTGKSISLLDYKKNLESIKSFDFNSNINNLKFLVLNEAGKKEYLFEIGDEKNTINVNEFSYNYLFKKNINFIDSFGFTNSDLKEVYIAVQQNDAEEILNSYIKEFDENVLNFKIMGGETPQCKVKDRDGYQDLNEFGDGLKHYISIICSLFACVDGYLFIDEIDNGIHYTQLDRLWEIILKISKEQNVQVFATTHSKECIDSYARVSKKLEDKDTCYIKMSKLKDGSIKAGIRDYAMLQDSIEDNHEVRGW